MLDEVRQTRLKDLKEQHKYLGGLIRSFEYPEELLKFASQAENVQNLIKQLEMGRFKVDVIRPSQIFATLIQESELYFILPYTSAVTKRKNTRVRFRIFSILK